MIRSIYIKVLVGFAAILALAVLALIGTTALVISRSAGPAEFVDRTHDFQAVSAAEAFERGGPPELRRHLDRLGAAYPGRHYLLDGTGRDLADGTDRGDLFARSIDHPTPMTNGEVVIVRATSDGRYRFAVVADPPGVVPALPYYLWIPVAVVAACLVLAYRLLRPVRRLQQAVRRFGRGELGARSGVTHRDEIGQLAADFDRMAERIERLVLAERRLLQDVSHELRSPLARLAFALELARSGPDRAEALDRAKREYQRMTDLVAELIELTHAEGEPLAEPMVAVALPELLRELVWEADLEAEAKGCRLVLDSPESLVLSGNARLLHRAFENVLRNAIRYAPPGSPVTLRLRSDAGIAEIRIQDAGPGVPAASLEAIFTPFFRVDADRSREGGGVGLGLSIARRIIAVHSGVIKARNGRPGLEVTIRIPENSARGIYKT